MFYFCLLRQLVVSVYSLTLSFFISSGIHSGHLDTGTPSLMALSYSALTSMLLNQPNTEPCSFTPTARLQKYLKHLSPINSHWKTKDLFFNDSICSGEICLSSESSFCEGFSSNWM